MKIKLLGTSSKRAVLLVASSLLLVTVLVGAAPAQKASAAYSQQMCNSSVSKHELVLSFGINNEDDNTVVPIGKCQKVTNSNFVVYIKGQSFRVGYNSDGYKGCQDKSPTHFTPNLSIAKIWFKDYNKDGCKN